MSKYLIIDCNNLLHRLFHMNKSDPDDIIVEHCHFGALQTMYRHYAMNQDAVVVAVFDGKRSWRKVYTKDTSQCVTHRKYKGLRNNDMTPRERARREKFDEHLEDFIDVIRNYTNVVVLQHKFLEADDLIAGWVQKFTEDEHIIISGDRDFMQLIADNVKLVNPADDKPRTLADYHGSSDYFMFEKRIRGETGKTSDNVQSAYPRLRRNKILEAYKDPYAHANIMQHEFVVEELDDNDNIIEHRYVTKDLFDENGLLMDLSMQPEYIREIMDSTIEDEIARERTFNKMNFLRYCAKNQMDAIIENGDYLTPMLMNVNANQLKDTSS